MLDDTVCKATQYFPQRNFMVAGKHFHGCRKTYLAFITCFMGFAEYLQFKL